MFNKGGATPKASNKKQKAPSGAGLKKNEDDKKDGQINIRDPPDFGKKKNLEDETNFITEEEFIKIKFDLDWPFIIKDLAKYLTGSDVLK